MAEQLTAVPFNDLPSAHDGYTVLYDNDKVCKSDVKLSELVGDISSYLTKEQADSLYQEKGEYLYISDSANFYPMTGNPSGFLTAHQSLDEYATQEWVNNKLEEDYYDVEETNDLLDEKLYVSSFEDVSGTFLTAHQDISFLVTKDELSAGVEDAKNYADEGIQEIANGLIDLTEYVESGFSNIEYEINEKLDTTAFESVSGDFLTSADLSNYYTKKEVNEEISKIGSYVVVEETTGDDHHPVVENPSTKVIYLTKITEGKLDNYYEWIYNADTENFECIGDTSLDLEDYYKKTETSGKNEISAALEGKEDKVFIAEYNVTTYQELLDAYNSGKQIVCKYSPNQNGAWLYANLTQYAPPGDTFAFASITWVNTYHFISCSLYGNWQDYSYNIQSELEAGTDLKISAGTIKVNTNGTVGDPNWYSFVEGAGTVATGYAAHAEGLSSYSFASATHAEGIETSALSPAAHSEGRYSYAVGLGAHAEGGSTYDNIKQGTSAVGEASHSEGISTIANGRGSHAEGFGTQANGDYSHAEGYTTQASGHYSHVEGQDNIAASYAHAEGQFNRALGSTSHTEGQWTTAQGYDSHTEGQSTFAIGGMAHAEGYGTTAISDCTHSEGGYTQANGIYSHSEGYGSTALGFASHVEGGGYDSDSPYAKRGNVAIGSASHAEGMATSAVGHYSHAEGSFTSAAGNNSHAGGLSSYVNTNASFVHGEGNIISGDNCDWSIAAGYQNSGFAQAGITLGYNNCVSGGTGPVALGINSFAHQGASIAAGDHCSAVGYAANATNYQSIASGSYSHAEGQTTSAEGQASHTEGCSTYTKGGQAHAEGYATSAIGYCSHTEGDNTIAYESQDHAEGSHSVASGGHNHAECDYTSAIGYASHAEGSHTLASGNNSHVEGFYNSAYGDANHAEGWQTVASGQYTHTEGYGTKTLNSCTHAEGYETSAKGYCSHAEGYSTIAGDDYMHAGGKFNKTSAHIAFVIGNGTYNARSDAFVVGWDGGMSAQRIATSGIADLEAKIKELENTISTLASYSARWVLTNN